MRWGKSFESVEDVLAGHSADDARAAYVSRGGDLFLVWRDTSARPGKGPRSSRRQMRVTKYERIPAGADWDAAMRTHGFLPKQKAEAA